MESLWILSCNRPLPISPEPTPKSCHDEFRSEAYEYVACPDPTFVMNSNISNCVIEYLKTIVPGTTYGKFADRFIHNLTVVSNLIPCGNRFFESCLRKAKMGVFFLNFGSVAFSVL